MLSTPIPGPSSSLPILICLIRPCTSLSVIIRHYPSLSVIIRPCTSLSVINRPCTSLSVLARPYPSLHVLIHPCHSLPFLVRPGTSLSVLARHYPSLPVLSCPSLGSLVLSLGGAYCKAIPFFLSYSLSVLFVKGIEVGFCMFRGLCATSMVQSIRRE